MSFDRDIYLENGLLENKEKPNNFDDEISYKINLLKIPDMKPKWDSQRGRAKSQRQ
jgi:hypothetical protein